MFVKDNRSGQVGVGVGGEKFRTGCDNPFFYLKEIMDI